MFTNAAVSAAMVRNLEISPSFDIDAAFASPKIGEAGIIAIAPITAAPSVEARRIRLNFDLIMLGVRFLGW